MCTPDPAGDFWALSDDEALNHVPPPFVADRIYFVLLAAGFVVLVYNMVSSYMLSTTPPEGKAKAEKVLQRIQDFLFYATGGGAGAAILYSVLAPLAS